MSELPDASGEKPSYLREFLFHRWNLYAALLSFAGGAMVSIPYGMETGILPMLGYGAAVAIASLFVPSHPVFRQWVDRRHRRERREQARAHLSAEVVRRIGIEHPTWPIYERMRERINSLRAIAGSRQTALTPSALERLDDGTVDFLGLWVARLAIDEREQAMDGKSLQKRVDDVDRQLKDAEPMDRRRLEKAKEDLERVIERRDRLHAKQASIEAAMIAMADMFEELYQGMVTNPNSEDVSRQLHEAVERMNIEEELGGALEEEESLRELVHLRRQTAQARTRSA